MRIKLNKRIIPISGMILLAFAISFLVYIGFHGIYVGANIPINDGDQRDLGFFTSLYDAISIVSFALTIPLLGIFVTQVVQLIRNRK
jgi:hypothetical protein